MIRARRFILAWGFLGYACVSSAAAQRLLAKPLKTEARNIAWQGTSPTCGPTALVNVMMRLEGGLDRFGFKDVDQKSPKAVSGVVKSLYDSVYNTPAEIRRNGRKINIRETSGVHFTALAEMAAKLGIDVEMHDADFEPSSVAYKTRPADQKYIDRRRKELKAMTVPQKLEGIDRLRGQLVQALDQGHMVAFRGTLAQRPETSHWWLVPGWDPRRPGEKLVLVNSWCADYVWSVRPEQLKGSVPGAKVAPLSAVWSWVDAFNEKSDRLRLARLPSAKRALKAELAALRERLLPHLTTIMIVKSK
jgi:hypothetical protein